MNSAPVDSPSEKQPPREGKVKVIDSLWTFIVAVAVAGPFALPLLWRNPRFSLVTKVVASIAVCAFTWALVKYSAVFLNYLVSSALDGQ